MSLNPRHLPRTKAPGFNDLSWVLALFGTAIGAGILYLPLQVGTGSLWALFLLAVLVFPLLYLAHRLVLEMLLLGNGEQDYSGVAGRYLGRGLDWLLLGGFFITFQTVLISYSIGLNASLGDVLHQQGWTLSNWSQTPYLSFSLLLGFALLYFVGETMLLQLMSAISGLLILALLGVSLYLIPLWDLSRFSVAITPLQLLDDMLLVAPILTFSLIFFPAMSSMVMALKATDPAWPSGANTRLRRLVLISSALLLVFVVFFVLSCVLVLSPEDFADAAKANLNGLSLLSHKPGLSPWLAEVGSMLGLCALFTSFVGVFLAVRDSAREALRRLTSSRHILLSPRASESLLLALVLGSAWIITNLNPSIIKAFGMLITPLVGLFIFILPVIVLARARGLKTLWQPGHLLVLLFGVLILFAYDLGTWLKPPS